MNANTLLFALRRALTKTTTTAIVRATTTKAVITTTARAATPKLEQLHEQQQQQQQQQQEHQQQQLQQEHQQQQQQQKQQQQQQQQRVLATTIFMKEISAGNKVKVSCCSSSSTDQDIKASLFFANKFEVLANSFKRIQRSCKKIQTKKLFLLFRSKCCSGNIDKCCWFVVDFQTRQSEENFCLLMFELRFNLIQDAKVQVRWVFLPLMSSCLSQSSTNWWLCSARRFQIAGFLQRMVQTSLEPLELDSQRISLFSFYCVYWMLLREWA